jgi:hypothetical protein
MIINPESGYICKDINTILKYAVVFVCLNSLTSLLENGTFEGKEKKKALEFAKNRLEKDERVQIFEEEQYKEIVKLLEKYKSGNFVQRYVKKIFKK